MFPCARQTWKKRLTAQKQTHTRFPNPHDWPTLHNRCLTVLLLLLWLMLPLPLIHYWHQAKRCYTYFYIRLIANKTRTFTRTHSSSVIRSVRPESCNVFFFVLTFFSFFHLLVLRLISFFSLSFPRIFGWNLTLNGFPCKASWMTFLHFFPPMR